jgi:hypothetical protein
MTDQSLASFWNQNREKIGTSLSKGIGAFAQEMLSGAESLGLKQIIEGENVIWLTQEDQPRFMFCRVSDPRNLDRILDIYIQAQKRHPILIMAFVHQWTDGDGNWNAFAITPRLAMVHIDRIWGKRGQTAQKEPPMREDIYTLFDCHHEFPTPGCRGWAQLLEGPKKNIFDRLKNLAAEHDCTQKTEASNVQWLNPKGQTEAMFFVLPDPGDIGFHIKIYEKIKETHCPVSFVFIKSEKPGCFDIFRLSARSYLEHHNQAKIWARDKIPSTRKKEKPIKELQGLHWSPRWTSLVGCIKGCLNYMGLKVSEARLFGASGHAFVLNIVHSLCPSGPTDWDTSRFFELGQNIGYRIENINGYFPKQADDLAAAQKEAWDFVRSSLDEDIPCFGWELDIPEYQVIYGYDSTGYYISGPGSESSRGPIPWQNLGRSEIGVVSVYNVRSTEPSENTKTICDAFSYALELGYNMRKWTDSSGGLAGYDAWIREMEKGSAGLFGLTYNAAVWAECRRFAVEFLKELQDQLEGKHRSLSQKAMEQYAITAENLKTVAETYPFSKGLRHEPIGINERSHAAAAALKQARKAEAAALEVLVEYLA